MIDSLAEIQFTSETKAHTTIFINKHSTIDSNLSIGMKTNEAQQIDNISFSSLRMASLCIQFESIWKFASNIFVTLNTVRFFQFNFFFFFFFFIHSATMYLSLFFFLQWFIVYPIYWNIMGYFIQFVEISSNHSCVLNTHKQIASRNILPVRWFNTLPKFISRKP